MQRLVEQLLLLTRADEGAVARNPRDVDVDDLVLAEAQAVAPPVSRSTSPGCTMPGSAATSRRSARWCATSSTTRPGTPDSVGGRLGRRARGQRRADGRGRRPRRAGGPAGSGSSSASSGSTRPAPVTPAAAASGWPSSRRSCAPTAARSRSRRRRGAVRGSSYGCRGRTPTCLPERAFRWLQGGFSEVLARWSHYTDNAPDERTLMFPARLRTKRIWIPTVAVVAAFGVGGTVWAASASADNLGGSERDRVVAAAKEAAGPGEVTSAETSDRDRTTRRRRPQRGLRGGDPQGRRHRDRGDARQEPRRSIGQDRDDDAGTARRRRGRRERRPRSRRPRAERHRAHLGRARPRPTAVGGGTVTDPEASDDRGVAYEVDVRKADGTEWDVDLDSSFAVVHKRSTADAPHRC